MLEAVSQVSQQSMNGMLFTALVSFLLPIALIISVRVNFKTKISNFFVGCVTYVFFAMFLEALFHGLILKLTGTAFSDQKVLYAIFAGLTAAIFEEMGRYVVMKYWMKDKLNRGSAIMYGVGHGGVEAIAVVGISYASNYLISKMINSGQLEETLAAMDETMRADTIQSLSSLWTSPAADFYVAGIERISVIILQIALSFLMFRAVKKNDPRLITMAMLIHFLVESITIILSLYIPIFALEGILMVAVLAIAVVIFKMYWKEEGGAINERL